MCDKEQWARVEDELATINEKLDNLQEIKIVNGDGNSITYDRNQFFQLNYDTRKELHGLVKDINNNNNIQTRKDKRWEQIITLIGGAITSGGMLYLLLDKLLS